MNNKSINIKSILKGIFKGLAIIVISFFILFICKMIHFRLNMIKNITISNNKVEVNMPKNRIKKDLKEVSYERDITINEVKNLNFILNGKKLEKDYKIYENIQRYFVPLEGCLNSFDIEFTKLNDDNYEIQGTTLDLSNNTFLKSNKLNNLRCDHLSIDGNNYISINDLEHILNLRDSWDNEKNTISLFKEKKELKNKVYGQATYRPAMIRLEDFAAGDEYVNSYFIEAYKVLADYLYSEGIVFHVAWVPRFKDPLKNIDNDLLSNKNMVNAQFMNLLDHLIYRGGNIGLHGYTHQAGLFKSTEGIELNEKFNTTEEETRAVAENAIRTAKTLNVPVDFFESPHYQATKGQQKILEDYFDILYEPDRTYWHLNPIVSLDNNSTVYVPAPLDYVKDENGLAMAKKIRKCGKYSLTSLFVHPTKELKFIKFNDMDKDGYIDYTYDENSPIHNIVKALSESNCKTISVREYK